MTSAIVLGTDLGAHATFGTCADCGVSICDPLGHLQHDTMARCVDCGVMAAALACEARDARTRCAVTSDGMRCVKPHHSDGVHTDGYATWVDGEKTEAERSGVSPLAAEPEDDEAAERAEEARRLADYNDGPPLFAAAREMLWTSDLTDTEAVRRMLFKLAVAYGNADDAIEKARPVLEAAVAFEKARSNLLGRRECEIATVDLVTAVRAMHAARGAS